MAENERFYNYINFNEIYQVIDRPTIKPSKI